MLGGGSFVSMTKKLPGTYINYVSASRNNVALGERGIVAMPISLTFGADGITVVDADNYESRTKELFGLSVDAEELKDVREVLKKGIKLYLYRLNGGGEKASNDIGTAKFAGTLGNKISTVVAVSVDDENKKTVTTFVDGNKEDSQIVSTSADLVDNNFVVFNKTVTLTAGTSTMTGGTDATVTGESYSSAFAEFEKLAFNTLAVKTTDEAIKSLAVSFTVRMRERVGAKFQTVLFNKAADHEGVINVDDVNAVPWVAGASAGCAINRSLVNAKYDGEYELKHDYTQTELEAAIDAGKFVFHTVDDEVHVLRDINSLVTFTLEKSADFSYNQVIRVLDEDAVQTAAIFNKTFLGKCQNNKDGRIALKSMLVTLAGEMQNVGALQNFDGDDITVIEGNLKTDVIVTKKLQPVVAMEKLYCTVYVN